MVSKFFEGGELVVVLSPASSKEIPQGFEKSILERGGKMLRSLGCGVLPSLRTFFGAGLSSDFVGFCEYSSCAEKVVA